MGINLFRLNPRRQNAKFRHLPTNCLLIIAFCIAACLLVPVASAATPIAVGTNFHGYLDSPAAIHQFTFHANRSDIIYISLGCMATLPGTPKATLCSPSMTELTSAHGASEATIVYTISSTGNYTILVEDYNHQNRFNYMLYVQSLNHPMNAPPIGTGTYHAQLGPWGEVNDYLIDGQRGGSVRIQLSQGSYMVIPEILLVAPNGTGLISMTGMYSVELSYDFPVTGRYLVLVGDRDRSDDMTYDMAVLLRPGPPEPPIANFTAQPLRARAPCSVQFTDFTTNEPTDWEWDFGDGLRSTERNPVHNYTTAGTYSVALTAYNEGGNSTLERADYIQILDPLLPLPGSGLPPRDLDGDGLSEDCNGNGRLDFADVVLFFNNLEWIHLQGLVADFDFNDNQRIDFADVVSLFGRL